MRESNFAFPAQNKACVCITSQLYDRRALDTTSPLPLFNSLTHLTYLTSTSPRIREIMTMDGGLERLVRILHEFCICPPPPENPAILYGLIPPNSLPPKPIPALNPHSFDKHAAYRFSLAFQCVVNIGVRGSEPIRSRVVQAGTLDVVGCILEAWLANKGFAVGPSSSATGMPRETREQRQLRRIAQMEQRQKEEAAHLQRALQRQLQVEQSQQYRSSRTSQRQDRYTRTGDEQDDSMDFSSAEGSTSHILLLSDSVAQPSNSNSDTDVSTDTSIAATPQESGTPTGTVVVNSRDRSGTIIARPIWDQIPTPGAAANAITAAAAGIPPFQITTTRTRRLRHHRELPPESPSDTSRPDTETEDDVDGDIDMDRMDLEEEEEEEDDNGRMDSDVPSASASVSGSPSPERPELHQSPPHRSHHHHHHRHHLTHHGHGHTHTHTHTHNRGRRAVGIVSDEPADGPQTLQVGGLDGGDAHIIINEAGGGVGGVEVGVVGVGVGPVGGVGVGVGVVEVGVEDGIISLEPNDDFAMGAPPGAPGAIGEGVTPRGLNLEGVGRRRNMTVSGVTNIAATGNTTGTTPGHGGFADAPDATPRAAIIGLPMMTANNGTMRGGQQQQQGGTVNYGHQRHATIRARPIAVESPTAGAGAGPVIPTVPTTTPTTAVTTHPTFPTRTSNTSVSHTPPHHTSSTSDSSGPYRDEDVLLSLQLLAYLSKYPHVRQAFYKPRVTFHPASIELGGQRFGSGEGKEKEKGKKEKERKGEKGMEKDKEREKVLEKDKDKEKGVFSSSSTTKDITGGFFKAFTSVASSLSNSGAISSSGNSRGKERAQPTSSTSSSQTVMAQPDPSSSTFASICTSSKLNSNSTPTPSSSTSTSTPIRQTNVFSLVERFTFKPSSTETDLPNPPPRLPPEIQYWAGVIMRNACRKDDSRGGIRQCANMICGKWESYPREFAKCRRCRKAKYCGKECQSTAWSEGHRFWCSAKDVEEDVNAVGGPGHGNAAAAAGGVVGVVGHGGGAGDHAQVPVQQRDQGDHGDLPSIHIAVDTTGDGNVPVGNANATATANGDPNLNLNGIRPERRRHGMGHSAGDEDVYRHAASTATVPGTYGSGLAGPGAAGPARAELTISRDRTVQPQHHHQAPNVVVVRQRPTICPMPAAGSGSGSGPSPTTATATATVNSFGMQQQQHQLQDPMNTDHLSFHISTTPSSSSSSSSLTAVQRRAREQQQQQARSVMSRRRADTVTGVMDFSSSPSTSNSTAASATLTPSQRAMVQTQLHLQEVPPNVVIPSAVGVNGHHHHHHHHHLLRNQYQNQNQAGTSSSSTVVGDWLMDPPGPGHTPSSSSSSSTAAAAAAAAVVSRPEAGPGPSSSRRHQHHHHHHQMVNSTIRSPPPAPPLTTTIMAASSGSRQKGYQRHGHERADDGDGDEDEGDEYEYEDPDGFRDDDMVLG